MSAAATHRRKENGAFYTPDRVARMLVGWVVRCEQDLLLDPACGDGRFIAAHTPAVGVEREPTAVVEAVRRAPHALIHASDFFVWAGTTHQRFDCAAGNPPFIRYQRFAGETRSRALRLAAQAGARFTGLASSWAPFLVVSASLLKPGGRLAFVVPAEIGHAPYAAPLVSYLVSHFRHVQIIAIRRKIFPQLSEDAWLLYADGFGSSTDRLAFTACERLPESATRPDPQMQISVQEWRRWNSRLRSFLLPDPVRQFYEQCGGAEGARRLGDRAQVGIGYVTGDNDFFHLRPSRARHWGIPSQFLIPAVRNARSLPPSCVTRSTVERWLRRDDPVLLLRIRPQDTLPAPVREYLDSPAGRHARKTYKCRHRKPWYVVPDVKRPHAFLSYMSGEGPVLVANAADCACTNSVHAVQLRDGSRLSELLEAWRHPLTRLSCEIEGHPLGGGVLKLEPREAARILLPEPATALSAADRRLLEDGLACMRRWRHYE